MATYMFLRTAVRAYEEECIRDALIKYNWDRPKTAKALGIGLSSLYRKIDEYGIKCAKKGSK